MEGAMAKKARVWNPAVDNDVIKEKFQHDRTTTDAPVDFSRTANSSLPLLIQNYFHLARAHQQRAVEDAFRQSFIPQFPMQTMPHIAPRISQLPTMVQPPQPLAQMMPCPVPSSSSSSSSTTPPGPSSNPLVNSALGVVAMTNENCCAICGSVFRLTADLVQHMRNNHRRTRFKRKNEKTFS